MRRPYNVRFVSTPRNVSHPPFWLFTGSGTEEKVRFPSPAGRGFHAAMCPLRH